MHLLLAIGGGLLLFILSVGNSCIELHKKNHVWTDLDKMKWCAENTIYKDEWMCRVSGAFNLYIPAEIREKSWNDLMEEHWGPNWRERRSDMKFDPSKTEATPRKKYWDDYFTRMYGEKYYRKYPFLKWPSRYDENGRLIL